ncbi:MAG: DNA recombination/repair protein RecA, partial [Moorea sp. SIO3G5]|nr:DNA recombination/repair protein RecA [Moorena sp. SIO3G5]
VKYLVEHPEFAENIEQQVREQLDMGAVVSANSVAPMDSKEAVCLEAGDEEA